MAFPAALLAITALLLVHTTAAPVRFFIDEGFFLDGETEILRALISASQGSMVLSGESTSAFLSVKGFYVPDDWDVYWTSISACHKAFPLMHSGKKVNCIPGASSITQKQQFVDTWQKAYGEAAFSYIPRSYQLPAQYWLWRSHLAVTQSPATAKWVLKANVHRGKGVQILDQSDVIREAMAPKKDSKPILVQQYLQPQMVVAGRSSYIRMWVLVTSYSPLRAYLFKGGFAVFGKAKGNSSSSSSAQAASEAGPAAGDDLVVNLWMQNRSNSVIWSVDQLCQHFDRHPAEVLPLPATGGRPTGGPQTSSSSSSSSTLPGVGAGAGQTAQRRMFDQAWSDMVQITTLALAAAAPSMRSEAAEDKAPSQGPFEYFGLDFVFDAHLQPWLLEVNAVPSMARRRRNICTSDASSAACKLTAAAQPPAAGDPEQPQPGDGFDVQKEYFVRDMLALLGLPVSGSKADTAAAAGWQLLPQPPTSIAAGTGSPAQVSSWLDGLSSWHLLQVLAAAAPISEQAPRGAAAASGAGFNTTQRRLFGWAPPVTSPPAEGPPLVTAGAAGGTASGWWQQQQQQQLSSRAPHWLHSLWAAVQSPLHWWNATPEAEVAAAAPARQQQQQQQQQHQGVQDQHHHSQLQRRLLQLPQQQQQQQQEAAGGPAPRRHRHRRHRRRRHGAKRRRRAAAAAATDAAAVTNGGLPGAFAPVAAAAAVSGTAAAVPVVAATVAAAAVPNSNSSSSSRMQPKRKAPGLSLQQLPEQWRRILCQPGQQQQQQHSKPGAASFRCGTCLLQSDLEALAALEYELSNLGRFTPVFDLFQAHALNQQGASSQAGSLGAPDSSRSSRSSGSNSSSSSSSSSSGSGHLTGHDKAATAAAAAPAVGPSSSVLVSAAAEDTTWQKLHKTWDILQQEGAGAGALAGGLGAMRNFTTSSQLPPVQSLQLNRQDYIQSAWLRQRLRSRQTEPQVSLQQGEDAKAGGGHSSCRVLGQDRVEPVKGPVLLQLLQQLTQACGLA